MRCKNVNSFVMPLNPSYSQTFPHEYFSIKPPETTAVSEGNQASLDDRELGEHCQTWTTDGKQETGAAGVYALVWCGEWHGAGHDVIVFLVPELLQQHDVVLSSVKLFT